MAKQYHKNPRQITAKQYEALAVDLAELGDLGGIVHDLNSDEIIGGNQRSRVFDLNACDVVLTEILPEPDAQGTVAHGYVLWKGNKYAYRQVRWTERQAERANIVANKRGGTWDMDILADQFEVDDLLDWGFEPFELGIEDAKPAAGDTEAQVDRAEELRQQWGVELGQMWQLGEHKLICGDCTDAATVARVMGGERAALMATDPPYGVAYTVETGVGSKFGAIANDENDGPRLQTFLESAFGVAKTALLDNAAWYLWHAQMTQGFFAAAAAAAAVIIHRQIIWVKPSLILGHGDYHWRHELCFYGWVEGHRPPWYGDRKQTTVWEVGRENDGVHPTQKPIELFERPLQFNTRTGDIAYEPFSGSGTTIIACENLGRKCRAVEISPAYCAVALQRWADHTGQTPVLLDQ